MATKITTADARKHFAGEKALVVTSAVAFLISSPFSRIIVNFFMSLDKPKYPTKAFNSEEEAIKWLKRYD